MIEQSRISELIAHPIGQDIVILNPDGECLASSDHQKIKKLFNIDCSNARQAYLKFSPRIRIKLVLKKEINYSPKELALLKNLAKMTLDQYLNAIAKPSVSIDQFVTQIVEQPIDNTNIKDYNDQAASFGLNLEVERAAVIVEIENFVEEYLSNSARNDYDRDEVIKDWKNKIISAINGFFTIQTDIISAYTGNGRFVFFKEISHNKENFIKYMKKAYLSIFGPVLDAKKENIAVGFSNPASGIDGLHETYNDALQALQLGKRFLGTKDESYFYGDLGTLRIITEKSPEKKISCAKEILEPLTKKTLRSTLETFFNENMDIRKTAAKLKIHPNTVNYRLTKIAEHLSLDPRIFKQAFELRIALLTDKIFR